MLQPSLNFYRIVPTEDISRQNIDFCGRPKSVSFYHEIVLLVTSQYILPVFTLKAHNYIVYNDMSQLKKYVYEKIYRRQPH